MEQLFARIPPRRRSPASVAVSAAVHLAAAIGALSFTQTAGPEVPRPVKQSIAFVTLGSKAAAPAKVFTPPAAGISRVTRPQPAAETASPPPPPIPSAATTKNMEPVPSRTAPGDGDSVPAVAADPPPRPAQVAVAVGLFDAGDASTRLGAIAGATAIVGGFDRAARGRVEPGVDRSAAAVASAGFGRTDARPSVEGARVDTVRSGGFDLARSQPTPASARRQTPIDTPVEIVFKPAPDYTDEAKALRIEGAIILEVEFAASSDVRVLRVLRGLGHGLDEEAVRAAGQIRFKPAQSAGTPVDFRATVHIVFRLS
jgi:TonB family protein